MVAVAKKLSCINEDFDEINNESNEQQNLDDKYVDINTRKMVMKMMTIKLRKSFITINKKSMTKNKY